MPLSREQSEIWEAMGIGPQWILRSAEDPLLPVQAAKPQPKRPAVQASAAPAPQPRLPARPAASGFGAARSVPAAAPIPGRVMPRRMVPGVSNAPAPEPAPQVIRIDPEIGQAAATASWGELKGLADRCHACQMAESRVNTVLAAGAPGCPIVIVGEAPGRDEDLQGFRLSERAASSLTTSSRL